jgi:hypothetical protein
MVSQTVLLLLCLCAAAEAQTSTLVQTSLLSGVAPSDAVVTVVSAANINPSNLLYVIASGVGESMRVIAVNGSAITVLRPADSVAGSFAAGATVYAGNPNWFYRYDPWGTCAASNTWVTPWVNTKNGNQWHCSTSNTWVLLGSGSSPSSPGTPATPSSPTVINFADAEVPSGPVDGTNLTFTLAHAPLGTSLQFVRNGVILKSGSDYTRSGATVTFINAAQPRAGDLIQAWYRY